MAEILTNSRVILHIAPATLSPYQGLEGTVKSVLPGFCPVASVEFDLEGGNTCRLSDIPVSYLRKIDNPIRPGNVRKSHAGDEGISLLNAPESRMNKTEERYLLEVLTPRLRSGEIIAVTFECVTFRLGHDCRYTPDFALFFPDGTLEFREVKGVGADGKPRWEDDAKVKIQTFRTLYPFRLVVVWHAHRAYPPVWNEMEVKK